MRARSRVTNVELRVACHARKYLNSPPRDRELMIECGMLIAVGIEHGGAVFPAGLMENKAHLACRHTRPFAGIIVRDDLSVRANRERM
jgi:hypothetical protein